jgi:hypothetical protein
MLICWDDEMHIVFFLPFCIRDNYEIGVMLQIFKPKDMLPIQNSKTMRHDQISSSKKKKVVSSTNSADHLTA